jgi:hypothetical protein
VTDIYTYICTHIHMYTWSFRHPCGHRARLSIYSNGCTHRRCASAACRHAASPRRTRAGHATRCNRNSRNATSVCGPKRRRVANANKPPDRNERERALCFGSRADPPRSHPKATNGACGRSGGNRRVNERVRHKRVCICIYLLYIDMRTGGRRRGH